MSSTKLTGCETGLMRDNGYSFLLDEGNKGDRVVSCKLLVVDSGESRDSEGNVVTFPGCQMLSILFSTEGRTEDVNCVYFGMVRFHEIDKRLAHRKTMDKSRKVLFICPLCGGAPSVGEKYHVLMYPAFRHQQTDEVTLTTSMMPRLTCLQCLQKVLSEPRVEGSSQNGKEKGPKLMKSIMVDGLGCPATKALRVLGRKPYYPYFDKNIRLPAHIEKQGDVIYNLIPQMVTLGDTGTYNALGKFRVETTANLTVDLLRCIVCHKKVTKQLWCGGCDDRKFMYCAKECSAEHWKLVHRKECLGQDATRVKPNRVTRPSTGKKVVFTEHISVRQVAYATW